jgi:hypothetical protein
MQRQTISYSVPPGPRGVSRPRERRVPRAAYLPVRLRTYHVLDTENLMGGPRSPDYSLHAAVAGYRKAINPVPGDHVVMACNPAIGLRVKRAWPSAQLLVRSGPDGADNALLDHLADLEWYAARYDRVVVGSGDRAFLPLVLGMQELGIPVGVVARVESFSADLRYAADFTRFLPGHPPVLEAA